MTAGNASAWTTPRLVPAACDRWRSAPSRFRSFGTQRCSKWITRPCSAAQQWPARAAASRFRSLDQLLCEPPLEAAHDRDQGQLTQAIRCPATRTRRRLRRGMRPRRRSSTFAAAAWTCRRRCAFASVTSWWAPSEEPPATRVHERELSSALSLSNLEQLSYSRAPTSHPNSSCVLHSLKTRQKARNPTTGPDQKNNRAASFSIQTPTELITRSPFDFPAATCVFRCVVYKQYVVASETSNEATDRISLEESPACQPASTQTPHIAFRRPEKESERRQASGDSKRRQEKQPTRILLPRSTSLPNTIVFYTAWPSFSTQTSAGNYRALW